MIHLGQIQGHWVRHWIRAPGYEDQTTRVHWMQAGRAFADIRIPLERPDTDGAACLAEMPPTKLRDLARAEGFAGYVTLDGDRCTWHREINWHGPSETPDVGAIDFDAQGRLIETGVVSDYNELWSQEAQAETQAVGLDGGGYIGILIRSGDVGVLGLGRRLQSTSAPLLMALDQGRCPVGVDKLFEGFHALCHFQGDAVIAELATDPFAEGHRVLTLREHDTVWHRIGFEGAQGETVLRKHTL